MMWREQDSGGGSQKSGAFGPKARSIRFLVNGGEVNQGEISTRTEARGTSEQVQGGAVKLRTGRKRGSLADQI